MTRQPGNDAWAPDGNAARYGAFAREFPLYRETSRDLVRRAAPEPGATVVDLACGTGATTTQILAALGPGGRVIGVDGSAAMLGEAATSVTDARVRWLQARAESFDQHLTESAAAVICNSAIWQTDLPQTARAARAVLAPAGRLVFNIGDEFLRLDRSADESSADESSADEGSARESSAPAVDAPPSLFTVMREIAETEYGWTAPAASAGRRRFSLDEVVEVVRQAGFGDVRTEWLEYLESPQERDAWLRIPVFTGSRLPGLSYRQRIDVLDGALRRYGPGEADTGRWFTVTANAG